MSHIRSRKHNPARIAAMVAATFSIAASAAEEATDQLPEVQVKSAAEVPFKADESASSKFTKPLVDTTQTVQVIKKEILREQGVISLTDALRNTPGITMQLGENGNTSAGDTFSMRGFATQNSLLVDGIRDLGAVTRDVFNLEQIEVVKGPAGADIGRGAASGYINLISKLPSLDNFNMATISYGTADKKRATIDVGQALGETTAVRLNAVGFDGDVDERDEVDNQNFAIAPSIAFGLGTPTRFYLYSQHVRQDNTPDGGIPSIGMSGFFNANANLNAGRKVDRENFYGSKKDAEDVDADMVTAKFEYDLDDKTTISNISRYGKTSLDRVLTGVNALAAPSADPATWTVSRSRQKIDRTDEILVNQTNLSTEFDLGGFKNTFSGGLEFMYENQKNKGFATTGLTIPLANLYNPNSDDALPMPFANGADTNGRTTTSALYAFDTIDLNDRWQLNAGIRAEHYNTNTHGGVIVTAGNASNFPGVAVGDLASYDVDESGNLFSWKVGALYKPAPNGSIYVSYATSETPPGSAALALSPIANNQNNPGLKPQETDNYEIGTKWDLLENQLSLSAAAFSTENSNQTSFDDVGQPTQTGRTRVNGVELLAVGQLTKAWQLSAGITAMKAKALDQQSNAGVVTSGVRWTPELSATLWSQYNLGDWTFGGGARYVGDQKRLVTDVDASTQNMPEIPSYVAADAMVAYQFSKELNLRLNVYNIFDKEYIETMNNSGARVRMGLPRSALLTAEFMF
jgi:catecholate siderophore receptor